MKNGIVILLLIVAIAGCTTKLPAEIVTLSSKNEAQLLSLQQSHVTLIQEHFKLVRSQREQWIQTVWLTEFLKNFIVDGRLEDTVKGQVVWDASADKFVSPKPPYEDVQKFNTLMVWTNEVQSQLAIKRKELISPLDVVEAQLIGKVNTAYSQLIANNATITAHLSSIKDVEDTQSRLMEKADLSGLNEDITKTLSGISSDTAKLLGTLNKANDKLGDK
jgi:hypothetical protein